MPLISKSIRSWTTVTPAEQLNSGTSKPPTPAAFRRSLEPQTFPDLSAYQPPERAQAPIIDNDTGQQVNDLSPQVAAMSSPIIDSDTGLRASDPVPLYRAANAPVIDNDTGLRANAFTPAPLMEQPLITLPPSFDIGFGIGESDPRKPINVGAGPRPYQPPIYTGADGVYDEQEATEEFQARLAKENQGRFRQVTSNFAAQGLGALGPSFSTIAEKTGAEIGGLRSKNIRDISNSLAAQWGTNYREKPGGTLLDKVLDPDWYATTIAGGAGSLVGSAAIAAIAAVPVMALGTVIAPIGVALGVSEGAIALTITIYRWGGSAATDSLLEMASAYSDARGSGKSIEEADRIANTVGVNNMLYATGAGVAGSGLAKLSRLLGSTAAAQRLAASSPVRNTLESRLVQNGFTQASVRAGSALTGRAVEGGNEWLQERQQGEIQKAAEDNRPWDFVRGVLSRDYEDDGVIGALGAIASGLGGSVVGGALRRGMSGSVFAQQAVDASLGARANRLAGDKGAPARPELGGMTRAMASELITGNKGAPAEPELEVSAQAMDAFASRIAGAPAAGAPAAGVTPAAGVDAAPATPAGAGGELDFSGQDLRGREFSHAERSGGLYGANFSNANLASVGLPMARLANINFTEADLSDADLTRADLRKTTLTGATLTGTILKGANLSEAKLEGVKLTGADLTGADLRNTDLTGANLTLAILTRAKLMGANLTDADFTSAVLTGADLEGANIESAHFEGAITIDKDGNETPFDAVAAIAPAPEVSSRTRDVYTPSEQWKGILTIAIGKRASRLGLTPKNFEGKKPKGKFWTTDEIDAIAKEVTGLEITPKRPSYEDVRIQEAARLREESKTPIEKFWENRRFGDYVTHAIKGESLRTGNAGKYVSRIDATSITKMADVESLIKQVEKVQEHIRQEFFRMNQYSTSYQSDPLFIEANSYIESKKQELIQQKDDLASGKVYDTTADEAPVVTDTTAAGVAGVDAATTPAGAGGDGKDGGGTVPPAPQDFSGQDLSGRDFSGQDLTGSDFSGAILTNANLTGANLTKAILTDANLTEANLTGAYLTKANLTEANLTEANLTGAYLSFANLTGADLSYAKLNNAYLPSANLYRATLNNANLSNANLMGADLLHAKLNNANLTRANLYRATLTGAYLSGADLFDADLSDADLTRANLYSADLTEATLRGTILTGATLTGANLTGADLRNTDLTGANLTLAYTLGAGGKQIPFVAPTTLSQPSVRMPQSMSMAAATGAATDAAARRADVAPVPVAPAGAPDTVLSESPRGTRIVVNGQTYQIKDRIDGGRTSDTYFADSLTNPDDQIVIKRIKRDQGGLKQLIASEYATLQSLHESGASVPRPILLNENPTDGGAPYFIMELAKGTKIREIRTQFQDYKIPEPYVVSIGIHILDVFEKLAAKQKQYMDWDLSNIYWNPGVAITQTGTYQTEGKRLALQDIVGDAKQQAAVASDKVTMIDFGILNDIPETDVTGEAEAIMLSHFWNEWITLLSGQALRPTTNESVDEYESRLINEMPNASRTLLAVIAEAQTSKGVFPDGPEAITNTKKSLEYIRDILYGVDRDVRTEEVLRHLRAGVAPDATAPAGAAPAGAAPDATTPAGAAPDAAGDAAAGAATTADQELRKEIIQFLAFDSRTGKPRVAVLTVDLGMKNRAAFENFAKQMKAKYPQAEMFRNEDIPTASGQISYSLNRGSRKYGNMLDEASKINFDTRVNGLLDIFGYKRADRNAEPIDPNRTYDAIEIDALKKIYTDAEEAQRKSKTFYTTNQHMMSFNEDKKSPGRAGNVWSRVQGSVDEAYRDALTRLNAAIKARGAGAPAAGASAGAAPAPAGAAPDATAPAGAAPDAAAEAEAEAEAAAGRAAARAMEKLKEQAATEDYSGRTLRGIDFSGRDLTRNKFIGANLSWANLEGAKLEGADLTDVNLTDANLRGAFLTGANLSNALMVRTRLAGANLEGATLTGAHTLDNAGDRIPFVPPKNIVGTPILSTAPSAPAPSTRIRGAAIADPSGESAQFDNILQRMAVAGGRLTNQEALTAGGFGRVGQLETAARADGRIISDGTGGWVPAKDVILPDVTERLRETLRARPETRTVTVDTPVAGSGGIPLDDAKNNLIGKAVNVSESVPVFKETDDTVEMPKVMKVGNIIAVRDDSVEGRQVLVKFAYGEDYPSIWIKTTKVSAYVRDKDLEGFYKDVKPITRTDADGLAATVLGSKEKAPEARERADSMVADTRKTFTENREKFLIELGAFGKDSAWDIVPVTPTEEALVMKPDVIAGTRVVTPREKNINPMEGSTKENLGSPLRKSETLTRTFNGQFNPDWKVHFDLKRFYLALESGNKGLADAYAQALLGVNGESAYGLGILLADVSDELKPATRLNFRPETIADGQRNDQTTAIADAMLAIRYLFSGDQEKSEAVTMQMLNGYSNKTLSASIDKDRYKLVNQIRDAVTNVNETGERSAAKDVIVMPFSEKDMAVLQTQKGIKEHIDRIIKEYTGEVFRVAIDIRDSRISGAIDAFNELTQSEKNVFDSNALEYVGDSAFYALDNMRAKREFQEKEELIKISTKDKEDLGINDIGKTISELSLTELLEAINDGTWDAGKIIPAIFESRNKDISDSSFAPMLAMAMEELGDGATEAQKNTYVEKLRTLLSQYFFASRSTSRSNMAENLIKAILIHRKDHAAIVANVDNYRDSLAKNISSKLEAEFNTKYSKFEKAKDAGAEVELNSFGEDGKKVVYRGTIETVNDIEAGRIASIIGDVASGGKMLFVKIIVDGTRTHTSMTDATGAADGADVLLRRMAPIEVGKPATERPDHRVPVAVADLMTPSVAAIVAKGVKASGDFPTRAVVASWTLGSALAFLGGAVRFKGDSSQSYIYDVANKMFGDGQKKNREELSVSEIARALYLNALGRKSTIEDYAKKIRSFDASREKISGIPSTLESVARLLLKMSASHISIVNFETKAKRSARKGENERTAVSRAKKELIDKVLGMWKAHVGADENYTAAAGALADVRADAVRAVAGAAVGEVTEGALAGAAITKVTYKSATGTDPESVIFTIKNISGRGSMTALKTLVRNNIFPGGYDVKTTHKGRGTDEYDVVVTGTGDNSLLNIHKALGVEKATGIATGLAGNPIVVPTAAVTLATPLEVAARRAARRGTAGTGAAPVTPVTPVTPVPVAPAPAGTGAAPVTPVTPVPARTPAPARTRAGARPSAPINPPTPLTAAGEQAASVVTTATGIIDAALVIRDTLTSGEADRLISELNSLFTVLEPFAGQASVSAAHEALEALIENIQSITEVTPKIMGFDPGGTAGVDPSARTNPLMKDGSTAIKHPDLNSNKFVIDALDAYQKESMSLATGEDIMGKFNDEETRIINKLKDATAEDINNFLSVTYRDTKYGVVVTKAELYKAIMGFVDPGIAKDITPIGIPVPPRVAVPRVAPAAGAPAPVSRRIPPKTPVAVDPAILAKTEKAYDDAMGAFAAATKKLDETAKAGDPTEDAIKKLNDAFTVKEAAFAAREVARGAPRRVVIRPPSTSVSGVRLPPKARAAAKKAEAAKKLETEAATPEVTAPEVTVTKTPAVRKTKEPPVRPMPKVRETPLENLAETKREIVQHIFDTTKTQIISTIEGEVINGLLNHDSMTIQEVGNLLGSSMTAKKALERLRDLNIAKFDSATGAYSFNPDYKTGGIRRPEATASSTGGIAPEGGMGGGDGGITTPPGIRPPSGTGGKGPKLPDLPIADVRQKSPGWFDYLKAFRNASLLLHPTGIAGDIVNSVVGNALVLNNARNFVTAAVENAFGVEQEKRVMTYKMARTYAGRSVGGIGKGAMDAIAAAFNPRQYLDSTSENFTLMTDVFEGKTGAGAAIGRTVLGVLEAGSRVRIAGDAMAVSIAKNGFAGAYAEHAADMRIQKDPSLDKIKTFEEERKKIELAMWYWGKVKNEGALDARALELPSGYTQDDLKAIENSEWENRQRLIKQMALNSVYRGEMAEILPDFGNLRANNPVIVFMIPFAQTLARVGYAGADAMPIVGQIMLGLDIKRGKYGKDATLTEAIQRGMTQEQVEGGRGLASHRVANQILGLSLAFVGGMLYAMKALMADGPEDDQEKGAWLDEGNRPFSLVIGGTSYNIITLLGPAAAPMMAGAKIYQEYLDDTYKSIEITPEKRNTILGHFEAIAKSTAQWWVNNTILRNFQDILNAAQGRQATDALSKFGSNSLMGFLPGSGLLRYITKQTDPYFRDPQNFLDYVNQNLPIEMRLGDMPVPVKRNDLDQAIQKTATERSAVPLNMTTIRTQRFKTPASDKNSQSPYRMIVSDSAREDYVNFRSYNKVMEFINKNGNAPRPTEAEIDLTASIMKRTKAMKLIDPINPLYEIRREQIRPYIHAERITRADEASGATAGGTK